VSISAQPEWSKLWLHFRQSTTKPIYNRVAYFDAMNDGRSVQEYDPRGKAAEEIQALYKWVTQV
jgi:cellulose biosynthesis protein BcsQ